MKVTFALRCGFYGNGRCYLGSLNSVEVGDNITSFKKKVREIVFTEEAREILQLKEKTRVKIDIGRWNICTEWIDDCQPLSKLPKTFLSESNNAMYHYVIYVA